MPMRFSTEAANADVMGEDPQPKGVPERVLHGVGADGTPLDGSAAAAEPDNKRVGAAATKVKEREPKESEASPGKDINAAGFVKDKDA